MVLPFFPKVHVSKCREWGGVVTCTTGSCCRCPTCFTLYLAIAWYAGHPFQDSFILFRFSAVRFCWCFEP